MSAKLSYIHLLSAAREMCSLAADTIRRERLRFSGSRIAEGNLRNTAALSGVKSLTRVQKANARMRRQRANTRWGDGGLGSQGREPAEPLPSPIAPGRVSRGGGVKQKKRRSRHRRLPLARSEVGATGSAAGRRDGGECPPRPASWAAGPDYRCQW